MSENCDLKRLGFQAEVDWNGDKIRMDIADDGFQDRIEQLKSVIEKKTEVVAEMQVLKDGDDDEPLEDESDLVMGELRYSSSNVIQLSE